MAYLKDKDTNAFITKYVNFNKTQELNLTVQTALDGTEYLTRFGSPVYSYELELYVNEAGKQLLMRSFDTLDLMEVKVRIGTFQGRIKSLDKFDEIYFGWYKVNCILSSESEVSER